MTKILIYSVFILITCGNSHIAHTDSIIKDKYSFNKSGIKVFVESNSILSNDNKHINKLGNIFTNRNDYWIYNSDDNNTILFTFSEYIFLNSINLNIKSSNITNSKLLFRASYVNPNTSDLYPSDIFFVSLPQSINKVIVNNDITWS